MRSSVINKYDRVTGDSISHVVDFLLKEKKKSDCGEIYSLLRSFVDYQNLNPKQKSKRIENKKNLKTLVKIKSFVQECREGL